MTIFSDIPDVLEVTLRDGSYLVDFQFTAEDTAIIASALDSTGFRWIEVGHGLGMNASAAGKGKAASTDEEYMDAAAGAIKSARWGMFCIPGIGRLEDLRLAEKYNMSFVRIGTNVTEIDEAQPFIALAKELGMIVSYNAMKSYAVPAAEFGRCAAQVAKWGADIVCLVDSAGGMFPDDIVAYLRSAQDSCDAKLGFHGHDNLALAMANTLRAIECGAVLVDSSLQGIGRSAGNTITEVLVAVLKKRGHLSNIDLNTVTDLGQSLIHPTWRRRGMDPMAVIGGSARFHSAFTGKVHAYAKKYDLDVRDLIIRLCEEDQVNAPDDLLDCLARELASQRIPRLVSIRAFDRHDPMPKSSMQALSALIDRIRPLATKAGKFAVLNVVVGQDPMDEFEVSGNIQNTMAHIVGSVTIGSQLQLESVLGAVDASVDVVFLDIDRKPFGPPAAERTAREILEHCILLTYSDDRLWVEAVEQQTARLFDEVIDGESIVIIGEHAKSYALSKNLGQRGARVSVLAGPNTTGSTSSEIEVCSCTDDTNMTNMTEKVPNKFDDSQAELSLSKASAVIVWTGGSAWFGQAEISRMKTEAYIIDASIGSILPEGVHKSHERGVVPLRVNIWPSLAGALLATHESARVCSEAMGWGSLNGVPVVAGGAIGIQGDVIVDSIRFPTRIVGVADGYGGVLFNHSPDQADRVSLVLEEIHRRLVAPAIDKD